MKVNMMHGAGGEVMGELLQTLTKFKHNNAGGIGLEALDDGAVIPLNGQNLVFTTDSSMVDSIEVTNTSFAADILKELNIIASKTSSTPPKTKPNRKHCRILERIFFQNLRGLNGYCVCNWLNCSVFIIMDCTTNPAAATRVAAAGFPTLFFPANR